MSWDAWIQNIMASPGVKEAAICGIESGKESVWASTPGLTGITVEQIKKLANDRREFPMKGCTIAGYTCRLLNDQMDIEGFNTCQFKTKAVTECDCPVSISVCKSKQTIVIVVGDKDIGGGPICDAAYKCGDNLRKSNY